MKLWKGGLAPWNNTQLIFLFSFFLGTRSPTVHGKLYIYVSESLKWQQRSKWKPVRIGETVCVLKLGAIDTRNTQRVPFSQAHTFVTWAQTAEPCRRLCEAKTENRTRKFEKTAVREMYSFPTSSPSFARPLPHRNIIISLLWYSLHGSPSYYFPLLSSISSVNIHCRTENICPCSYLTVI